MFRAQKNDNVVRYNKLVTFLSYYLGMLWMVEKELLLHNEWARLLYGPAWCPL